MGSGSKSLLHNVTTDNESKLAQRPGKCTVGGAMVGLLAKSEVGRDANVDEIKGVGDGGQMEQIEHGAVEGVAGVTLNKNRSFRRVTLGIGSEITFVRSVLLAQSESM